jgi:ribosomal protein S18 acetylase RimI-like enzyme
MPAQRANLGHVRRAPPSRNGAGKALLAEVIRLAKTDPGLRSILLSVSETQPAARRLYESMGFVHYGTEPVALRVGDRDLAEEFLALRLY